MNLVLLAAISFSMIPLLTLAFLAYWAVRSGWARSKASGSYWREVEAELAWESLEELGVEESWDNKSWDSNRTVAISDLSALLRPTRTRR